MHRQLLNRRTLPDKGDPLQWPKSDSGIVPDVSASRPLRPEWAASLLYGGNFPESPFLWAEWCSTLSGESISAEYRTVTTLLRDLNRLLQGLPSIDKISSVVVASLRTFRSATRLFFLALAAASLASTEQYQSLVGYVTSARSSSLEIVTSSTLRYTLVCDSSSKIWRGRLYSDCSAVRTGDEVTLRWTRDNHGQLLITDLWANIDTISGKITAVASGSFKVDQNFDADPMSGYKRQSRAISWNQDTEFSESAPDDLKVGRIILAVGLRLNAVSLFATRLIVYENGKPVRMRPGTKIIMPDGTVRKPQ